MADRVVVPRLLSRAPTMWLSVAAVVVGVPAVVGFLWATQPDNRPFALALGVIVVVGALLLLVRRTWLDTARGTVVREVLLVRRQSVAWADAEVVKLTNNRAGQLMLEVRGAGRRTSIHLPLVAVDLGGDRSQSAEFLGVLADQIEHWAPQRSSVVTKLRAQAEHVASGGGVRESPLARAHLARPR